MKISAATALCCVAAASVYGMAQALPGQKVSTVVAAIHAKPFTTKKIISEMSGMPMYNATKPYKGGRIFYHIEDMTDHISFHETVTYDAPGFSFNNKSDPRVHAVLALVYDGAIADDYVHAKAVAVVPVYQSKLKTTFFKGARYAYAGGSDGITLYALKDLAEQIKEAKQCAKTDCGD